MTNPRPWFPFVNNFKEHIDDLYVVNRLITAAGSSIEEEETDAAMNLLIAANEFLSRQSAVICEDLEIAIRDFIIPPAPSPSPSPSEKVDVFG